MATVDLSGVANLRRRLDKIENIDATPLMVGFMRIVQDDNRSGVLAGTDKDGKPMTPVKYRPRPPATRSGTRRSSPAVLPNDNLSSAEYRKLSGPPLAPRGVFSRVITNLVTGFLVDRSRRAWTAVAGWADVVDPRGRQFLHDHFEGAGDLPRRDLRGVRPEGLAKAERAAVAFTRDLLRTVSNG